jgi:dihydrofolate reductase
VVEATTEEQRSHNEPGQKLNQSNRKVVQLLGADSTADVAALKKRYPGDLILYGIGELANYLAHQNLVDEVRFWIHPISATTYASGLVRLAYQPTAE